MSSGVLDFSGGPLRIRSKLSRNLNSGDRIALALATPATTGGTIFRSNIRNNSSINPISHNLFFVFKKASPAGRAYMSKRSN